MLFIHDRQNIFKLLNFSKLLIQYIISLHNSKIERYGCFSEVIYYLSHLDILKFGDFPADGIKMVDIALIIKE